MLPSTVGNDDDSAVPPERATTSVEAAVDEQVPLVKRLKVTVPVGVPLLPVTIALSCTVVPTSTVWPVMSACAGLCTSVAVPDCHLSTFSGSHSAVELL